MNKLREKFKNAFPYSSNKDFLDKCEQINDDFTLKFFKWCNVAKYELPNEMSVEEKLQYFKQNIYEKI